MPTPPNSDTAAEAERRRCATLAGIAATAMRLGVEVDLGAAIRSGVAVDQFLTVVFADLAAEITPAPQAESVDEMLSGLS